MQTIYKYEITNLDHTIINMPTFAKILHAGVQDGKIYIWARVNTDELASPRIIRCYGTGNDCSYEGDQVYLGTVQLGLFVWHVFELQ